MTDSRAFLDRLAKVPTHVTDDYEPSDDELEIYYSRGNDKSDWQHKATEAQKLK